MGLSQDSKLPETRDFGRSNMLPNFFWGAMTFQNNSTHPFAEINMLDLIIWSTGQYQIWLQGPSNIRTSFWGIVGPPPTPYDWWMPYTLAQQRNSSKVIVTRRRKPLWTPFPTVPVAFIWGTHLTRALLMLQIPWHTKLKWQKRMSLVFLSLWFTAVHLQRATLQNAMTMRASMSRAKVVWYSCQTC